MRKYLISLLFFVCVLGPGCIDKKTPKEPISTPTATQVPTNPAKSESSKTGSKTNKPSPKAVIPTHIHISSLEFPSQTRLESFYHSRSGRVASEISNELPFSRAAGFLANRSLIAKYLIRKYLNIY